jgi:hypothetical protein
MIPGILTSSGNLGALTPHQITVTPLAGEAISKGDLVRFDLGDTVAATDYTTLLDFDNKKNPFNVVIKNPTTAADGGIWGIALEAGVSGSRFKVCISGLVEATVFATANTINSLGAVLAPDTAAAGRLTQQATGVVGLGLWMGVVASPLTGAGSISASASATSYVLFNGFVFGSSAA